MNNVPAIDTSREIITERVLDFPATLVFRAWTEPGLLKSWWGPAGFTNTFHEFDLRPGGQWRFTMHGPEKGNYENHCEFIHIDQPSLIWWKRHSKPLFQVLVNFQEIERSKTRMIFRMIFDTKEESDKIRPFATGKNEENFDKLEKVLEGILSESVGLS